MEYLPGQFDQRAASAVDCVHLIDPTARMQHTEFVELLIVLTARRLRGDACEDPPLLHQSVESRERPERAQPTWSRPR